MGAEASTSAERKNAPDSDFASNPDLASGSAAKKQKLLSKLANTDLFPHVPFYHEKGPTILQDASLVRECRYALAPPPNCIVSVNGMTRLFLIKLPCDTPAGGGAPGTGTAGGGAGGGGGGADVFGSSDHHGHHGAAGTASLHQSFDAGRAADGETDMMARLSQAALVASSGTAVLITDAKPDSFFDSTIPRDDMVEDSNSNGSTGGGISSAVAAAGAKMASAASSAYSTARSAVTSSSSSSSVAAASGSPTPISANGSAATPPLGRKVTVENAKRFHWIFYNDSIMVRFAIKYYFPPGHGTIKAVGNVDIVLETAGWTRVSICLDPGETARFSGAPMDCPENDFIHDVQAQSLPDSYNERAAHLHERRIAQHFAPGSTMSLVLDSLEVSSRVGAPVDRQGSLTPVLLRWCVENNVPFVDPIFRPNSASLGQGRKLPWRRPLEMNSKAGVPTVCALKHIRNRCIQPGSLGDAWLICALSALTDAPKRLRSMFIGDVQERDAGAYVVRLCKDGWWRIVVVDDFLPALGYGFAFANINVLMQSSTSSSGGGGKERLCPCEVPIEMWIGLLEKAYAKVAGNYSNIVNGDFLQALQDLTGFPTMSFEQMGWREIRLNQQVQRRFAMAEKNRRRREQKFARELMKHMQARQAAIDEMLGVSDGDAAVSVGVRPRSASEHTRALEDDDDEGLYGGSKMVASVEQNRRDEERELNKLRRQQAHQEEMDALQRKINQSPDHKSGSGSDSAARNNNDARSAPVVSSTATAATEMKSATKREPSAAASTAGAEAGLESAKSGLISVGSVILTAQDLGLDPQLLRFGTQSEIQASVARAAAAACSRTEDAATKAELEWLGRTDPKEYQKKADEAAAELFERVHQHVMEREHIVAMVTPCADDKRAKKTFCVKDSAALESFFAAKGLTLGRAYVVTRVVRDRQSNIQLLQLRDPWLVSDAGARGNEGVVMWNGDWSYDSNLWSQHPSVAQACDMLHLVTTEEDGITTTTDNNNLNHNSSSSRGGSVSKANSSRRPTKRTYDGRFWISWSDLQIYFDGGGVCFAPRFDVGASPLNKKAEADKIYNMARLAQEAVNNKTVASKSNTSSNNNNKSNKGAAAAAAAAAAVMTEIEQQHRGLFGSASEGPWYDYRVRGDFLTAKKKKSQELLMDADDNSSSSSADDFVYAGASNIVLEMKNLSDKPIPMMIIMSQIDRVGLSKDHPLVDEEYVGMSICVGKLSKQDQLRDKDTLLDMNVANIYLNKAPGSPVGGAGEEQQHDYGDYNLEAKPQPGAREVVTHADIGARSVRKGGEDSVSGGCSGGVRRGRRNPVVKCKMDDPTQWVRGRTVELIGASGKHPTDGLQAEFNFCYGRDVAVQWTLEPGDPDQVFVIIPRCTCPTTDATSKNTRMPFTVGIISAVPVVGNFSVDFKRIHPHCDLFWHNRPRFWYDARSAFAAYQSPSLTLNKSTIAYSRWGFDDHLSDDGAERCFEMKKEQHMLVEKGRENLEMRLREKEMEEKKKQQQQQQQSAAATAAAVGLHAKKTYYS